jgi:DNA-binding beta-propeller fold protein YncE
MLVKDPVAPVPPSPVAGKLVVRWLSGRVWRSWTLTSLVALLALAAFLLGSVPAWAVRGHEFSGTLGEACASAPCGPRELKAPSALAVDEASGDVYVLDEGNARVQRFGAKGEYLGQFDASGKFEVTSDPEPQKEGTPAPTGTLSFSGKAQVSGIAVDNSCSLQGLAEPQCAVSDPSHDDVYVIDPGHAVIDKFNPRGEYLGQITETIAEGSAEPLSLPSGVAVDKQGSVWVIQKDHNVRLGLLERFANTEANPFEGPLEVQSGRGFLSPGLAVDGEGAFYRLTEPNGGFFQAEKLNPQGHITDEEFGLQSATGLAADQLTDNAFIDNASSIGAFASEGKELERLTVPGEHGSGLGTDAGQEVLYAADKEANLINVYTPKLAGPPTVENDAVSEASADSASFTGEINPRGAPTTYRFEYGPCNSPSTCAQSPYPSSVPVPDGPVGEDFELEAVEAHVQGLSAARSYHVRLTARNEAGGTVNEASGEEKTFITEGAGGGLVLPDARQWEMVSPAEKLGALLAPIKETGMVAAAASGDGITYLANAPIETQPQGYAKEAQILSTRSGGAWRSENLTVPHGAVTTEPVGPGHEYHQFSEDLLYSFVQPFGVFTPSISAEASEQTAFRRSDYANGDPAKTCDPLSMNCFRPLVTGAAGFANVPAGTVFGACPNFTLVCGPEVEDATPDGGHAVLRSSVALTEAPIAGEELYEWDAQAAPSSQLQLISVLPGAGGPASGPKLGFQNRNTRGAISGDGSRVVFEAQSPAALYMRDSARGQTVQLDKAEAACEGEGECESGGGRFQLASTDGSRVLFTDSRRLTGNAGKAAGGEDLYECEVVTGSGGEDECLLSDLTPETGGESANVLGTVIGSSEDGQWVYFTANGVLASQADSEGEQAKAGGCTLSTAPAGKTCNLYLRHGGQTRLVAVLGSGDLKDWAQELRGLPARVSPSGQWLALMSERSLTGYDNGDAKTGRPDAEVYLYDAAADKLRCASCLASGARPSGVEYKKLEPGSGGLVGGPRDIWPSSALVAANVPGWVGDAEAGLNSRHQPRYLADDGRLFFNSADGLVPQDVNATEDVYQYEPPGVGSCSEESSGFAARSGGCVNLISSGESSQESAFLDASQSGNDVFFLTSQALIPTEDRDSARDVYDAHACSGASPCPPEEAAEPAPCDTGDSCKAAPAPQPEIFGSPASAQFSGPGNPAPVPQVKPKVTVLTRAQKLAAALKACKKDRLKSTRVGCEKQAKKKYGVKPKAKPKRKKK